MDDDRLKQIIENHISEAVGYLGGEIANERSLALDYYHGEKFGGEIEGRSQVISLDVQDTIESMMPDMMEIFAGSDIVVEFKPNSEEDEEGAKQATEYVNYIANNDNEGFINTHDFVKDALLQKNGVFKTWWETRDHVTRRTLKNVNSLALQEIQADPDQKVVAITPREVSEVESPDGVMYELTVERTEKRGRVKEECVPPEEFLISRRAKALSTARFTCHKVKKTISELIEEGYKKALVEEIAAGIAAGRENDLSEETTTRFDGEESLAEDDSLDPSMREVLVYECYLLVDYDGDDIAEMRQVVVAGPGYEILSNEEVDAHPFSGSPSIKLPHRWIGKAVADLVMDIQLIKSMVLRQLLDNMYFVNNARTAISDQVNLDDWLTMRPGGAVRITTGAMGGVSNHILPIPTVPIGNHAYPLLEHLDGIREVRTGVTRYNQGTDAQSLNKTATGINQILGRAQQRLLLVARIIAEMAMKERYRKILKLVIENQDAPRIIRLRNEYIPMDPTIWNPEMDVQINVGLGHGTREGQSTMLQLLLQIQKAVVEFQGGASGPLVTLQNIYNLVAKLTNLSGFKNVDSFFTDPGDQVPPPAPDPEMMKIQGQMQIAQAKSQADEKKMMLQAQMDQQAQQQEMALKERMAQIDIQKAQLELELKKQELALKSQEAQMDMQFKQRAGEMDLSMKQQAHQFQMQTMAAKAAQPQPQ